MEEIEVKNYLEQTLKRTREEIISFKNKYKNIENKKDYKKNINDLLYKSLFDHSLNKCLSDMKISNFFYDIEIKNNEINITNPYNEEIITDFKIFLEFLNVKLIIYNNILLYFRRKNKINIVICFKQKNFIFFYLFNLGTKIPETEFYLQNLNKYESNIDYKIITKFSLKDLDFFNSIFLILQFNIFLNYLNYEKIVLNNVKVIEVFVEYLRDMDIFLLLFLLFILETYVKSTNNLLFREEYENKITLNKFKFKMIIDENIEKYKKFQKQIPTNIKLDLNYYEVKNGIKKRTPITYDQYVRYLANFITRFRDKINVLDYIYKKTDISKENCSELFYLFSDTIVRFIGKEEHKYNYSEQSFFQIALDLKEKVKNCKFVPISFHVQIDQKEQHYNSGFLEYDNGNFFLSYYEPHGNRDIKNLVKNFLNEMNRNGIFIMINKEEISSQTLSEDKYGFCVLFGLFWIHLVFEIISYNLKNNTYVSSKEWIDKVETYYIRRLTKNELLRVVLAYGIETINNYFIENGLYDKFLEYVEGLDEIKKTIPQISSLTYNQNELQRELEIKQFQNKKGYSQKELNKPHLSYELWEKEVKKENKDYKEFLDYIKYKDLVDYWNEYVKTKGYKIEGNEVIIGKKLGENCDQDLDCFSKKCFQDQDGEKYCYPNI